MQHHSNIIKTNSSKQWEK